MRRVVWFSCGAASAVVAKIVREMDPLAHVVYCDVMGDEHPDNARFFAEVESWIGGRIERIESERFRSVNDVFEKRRYMAGIHGAPCTVEMKKRPRFAYEQPDDLHYFGFTADEQRRIDRFEANNPDLATEWVLLDREIFKEDCLEILDNAGIELPAMYQLGYKNNNCLGCVKATSARYWNMVRRDFPQVFDLRALQSRELGAKLTRVRGERVFLDELPADYLPSEPLEDISCGPDCAIPGGDDEG